MDTRKETLESGIILLYKPNGITSNNVIQKIKKHLGIKKIGHAGTLDKFAQGLLIVLVGKATKLSDSFLNLDKEYIARIQFGKETSTLDPEGEIIKTSTIPHINSIKKEVGKFIGIIVQRPPKYSAIHINGRRSSELMRRGQDFEIPSRRVSIYRNEIITINLPYIEINCKVSKGTYIRSLARDIGYSCDSCAYLEYLERVAIGEWNISQSISLDELLSLKSLVKRQGVYSFWDIISASPCNKEVFTQNIDVRNNLKFGRQPTDILDAYTQEHFEFLCLKDKEGLIGVWKKNNNSWKLLLSS